VTKRPKPPERSAPSEARSIRRLLVEHRLDEALGLADEHFRKDPTSESAKELLIEVYHRQSEQEEMTPLDWLLFIVQLAQLGVVEGWMAQTYFDNLERHLESLRPRRPEPGKLIIGLGTGRNGSTSLAALLDQSEDAYITHELPPILYWSPTDAQLAFHLRRFRVLADFYAHVGDVSHWWLTCVDAIREAFPDVSFVGVRRDVDETLRSFERIKGEGRGAINHWQRHDGSYWSRNIWDPCYPKTGAPCSPRSSEQELHEQRRGALRQYIEDYNARMESDASVLVLATEELNDPHVVDRLRAHAGIELAHQTIVANVGGIQDSHWQGRF